MKMLSKNENKNHLPNGEATGGEKIIYALKEQIKLSNPDLSSKDFVCHNDSHSDHTDHMDADN